MAKKYRINEDLFNQIFSPSSPQQAEILRNQIYSVIEVREDTNDDSEEISESTIDNLFSVRSTLKIINLK
ncbi:MAG: hypothetical protein ACI4B3_10410 [Prevotella sp.]